MDKIPTHLSLGTSSNLPPPPLSLSSRLPPPLTARTPEDLPQVLQVTEEELDNGPTWNDFENYSASSFFTSVRLCYQSPVLCTVKWLAREKTAGDDVPLAILNSPDEYPFCVVEMCRFFVCPFNVIDGSIDVFGSHCEIRNTSQQLLKRHSQSLRRNTTAEGGLLPAPSPSPSLPPPISPRKGTTPRARAGTNIPNAISSFSEDPPPPPPKREKDEDRMDTSLFRVSSNLADFVPKSRKGFTLHSNADDAKGANSLYSFQPFDPTLRPKYLMMSCQNIAIELGSSFEPYYCSATLLQCHNGRTTRLSAPFHFHLNSSSLMTSIVGDQWHQIDRLQHIRKGLFSITNPNPDIILVLKMAKPMRSVESEKFYLKPVLAKSKDIEKMKKETKELDPTEYMQPFAWAYHHIFDDEGSILSPDVMVTELRHLRLPLSDENIFEAMEEKKEKKEKSKFIRGQVDLSFLLLDNPNTPGILTPEYVPLTDGISPRDTTRLVRDLGELTYPNTYVNSMYLYPESVQLKHSSNLMLEFQLRPSDKAGVRPLRAFRNPYANTPIAETAITWVTHKEKKDQFLDELEVHLPANIDTKYHFLVTIYIVNEKPKKKEDKKTPFGYVVIPLMTNSGNNCVISDGRSSYPVLMSLPADYLSCFNDPSLFHEAKKPLFSMKSRLISSIFTNDVHLCEIFSAVKPGQPKKTLTHTLEEHVSHIDPFVAYQFLPFLLDCILGTLEDPAHDIKKHSLGLIVSLLTHIRKRVDNSNLNNFLRSYVWYWYTQQKRPIQIDIKEKSATSGSENILFKNLIPAWAALLEAPPANCTLTGHEAWFFLDLMIKSALLHFHSIGYSKSGPLQKEMRMTWYSGEWLASFEKIMFAVLAPNRLTGGKYSVYLATRLILNLLQIADRGRLFTWMRTYFKKMEPDDQHSVKVKFSILRGLVGDQNFIPLNLPVPIPIKSISTLALQFWKVHYLAGQIVNEVSNCLTDFNSPDVNFCRKFAIDSFNNILQKLEAKSNDPRAVELFFPFAPIVSKNILVIEQFTAAQKYDWLFAFLRLLSVTLDETLRSYWMSETQRGLTLFCKTLSVSLKVISESSHQRLRQVTVLSASSSSTKYDEMTMKDLKLMRQKANRDAEATGEGDLIIHDAYVIVCHIVSKFLKFLEVEMSGDDGHLVGEIFNVIHDIGQAFSNGSPELLSRCGYFIILKLFVSKFANVLFKLQNTFCVKLTYDVLNHCNSPLASVRSKARAIFYLLLDMNYSVTGEYEKMAVVSSVALSELLGTNVITNSKILSDSLDCVREYAIKTLRGSGKEGQIEGLSKILNKITTLLEYNQKINEVSTIDPELTTDLYEKISNAYLEAPDTRVQWLENMASYHFSHKNFLEAALCKIHHAELIREFLHTYGRTEVETKLPVMSQHFISISPSIQREPRLPKLEQEKVAQKFQLSSWSIEGMVKLLTDAVGWLKEATCYEYCLEIYSVVEIIFKYTKNYEKLKNVLQGYQDTVALLLQEGTTRLTPKYFRVSYFGTKVGSVSGKGYIYRVGPGTSLHSFTAQIKNSFKGVVKSDSDFVILSNKPVDSESLDHEKIYLQIGGITVYYSDGTPENENEQNHNVDKFLFEMSHQKTQKKKLIYTVERPFPYIKTRLEIVKMDELILSPIEAAIENVMDRVKSIRSELTAPTPRVNTLQQILQGSVVPMVNEGPLKICADFLAAEVVDQFDPKCVATLRDALRDFIRNCGFALRLNARLIDEKHKPFQDMCQQKYEELSKMIKKYID